VKIEIVELKSSEASLCKELRLRALKDAPTAFSETYEQVIEFDSSYWELISNSMVEPNLQRMFIAKKSANCVGSVYALIDQNDSTVGRLGGMWVESANRNNGIGVKLFNSHKNWAMKLKFKSIKLWVQESENCAKPFYSKLGFIETGIKKQCLDKVLCEMQFDL